jgi:enoyl-[acyl-carrier protein] reductase I
MTDAQGQASDRPVGLIVGVANRRSIAWAIAQAMASRGARLVLTYQSERLGENVRDLAATLALAPLLLPCDLADDAQVAELFSSIEAEHGALDFLVHAAAFAPRESLMASYVETSREAFRIALDVSAYSMVALARGAAPLMRRRGGGSMLTLTYLGSERVFPNYNVMGVAKAALEATVRYLAADLGPDNIRVNAISAGPIKTLAAAGIAGFSNILTVYRERAPLRRTVEAKEVAEAAAFLLGPGGGAITGEILVVDAGFRVTGM